MCVCVRACALQLTVFPLKIIMVNILIHSKNPADRAHSRRLRAYVVCAGCVYICVCARAYVSYKVVILLSDVLSTGPLIAIACTHADCARMWCARGWRCGCEESLNYTCSIPYSQYKYAFLYSQVKNRITSHLLNRQLLLATQVR